MFCDKCGATVPQNQRFCGNCGRAFYTMVPVTYVQQSRVQQHVRMLGILWTAYSALVALGSLACFIVAAVMTNIIRFGNGGPPAFIPPLLHIIGTVILILSMFGFLAGWGLINREPWARMLTIVLSFFAMFKVPFGTALGIYGLWVLLPEASEREYELTAKKTSAA
ncbi:hypothetical protein Acid345_2759 [Candidatus Koribacter versatilis Ellin345]|uniref:Zinc-ribbon domain-containing protein n=1 Tax=Koribacter versatilis (strain Ellin345) TaxID=204669 RepID=Q1IMZ0_KORVE|nr:zinc ribbon domain-containing protein [Candidatus Koribacter versatilis]ABF41760.1 hypothetical protein Acid345_2759 [Candidatus Koribacter versatilis Ellin345]